MSIYKSAVTGEIVTEKFARENPDTTYRATKNKEIQMKKDTTSKKKEAVVKSGDKKPDGAIKKDGVKVEVVVEKQGAGTSEDKTPDGQDASGDVTPLGTPTPTQIIQTPPKPIVTHEDGRDQKIVRHDEQPGTGVPTTVVEEVVMVDNVSEDRDGMIRAMAVKAQSQGVNQSAVLKGGEVLTVYQDGTHRIDEAPHVDVREED
jgi:hypothetical protein